MNKYFILRYCLSILLVSFVLFCLGYFLYGKYEINFYNYIDYNLIFTMLLSIVILFFSNYKYIFNKKWFNNIYMIVIETIFIYIIIPLFFIETGRYLIDFIFSSYF